MKPKLVTHENGLQSLFVRDTNTQSVTIMVLVRIGSRYESKAKSGLAHFVEHTIFKGTQKRPSSKQIGMEIELLGGLSNAFTSYDYTGYYIKVPKYNFAKAFEILADMVRNSMFSEVEIEKERGVIIEEIRMYEDLPKSKVASVFAANMFKGNMLGEDIAGSVDSVTSLKRNDFLEFVKTNYNGGNILLSLSGNFEEMEANKLISDYYSDLPKGKGSSFNKAKRYNLRSTQIHHKKQLEQTHIVMGGFGYERKTEKKFGLKIGNSILSYGFGSKLFQVIRDELGLAYYVGSSHDSFEEIGTFDVSMGVANSKKEEAVNAVLEQLLQLKQGKFTDDELLRAKNFLIGALTSELETSDEIASWYGLQQLLQHEIILLDDYIKSIAAISRDDVVEAWAPMLKPENMLFVSLGNEKLDVSRLKLELLA